MWTLAEERPAIRRPEWALHIAISRWHRMLLLASAFASMEDLQDFWASGRCARSVGTVLLSHWDLLCC
jgi:hypothetical protein